MKVNERTKLNPKTGEKRQIVKYASLHDFLRSFGERWATRVMPQVLMVLMRHESIQTRMAYYVGRNAQTTADAVWAAYGQNRGRNGAILGAIDQNPASVAGTGKS